MPLTEELKRKFEKEHGVTFQEMRDDMSLGRRMLKRTGSKYTEGGEIRGFTHSWKDRVSPVDADKRNRQIFKAW